MPTIQHFGEPEAVFKTTRLFPKKYKELELQPCDNDILTKIHVVIFLPISKEMILEPEQ